MYFTTEPTETTNAASRTADPPTASRRPDKNRRGGGCLRWRPLVRDDRVRYPELVTKVAPVIPRALVVRNILHDKLHTTSHGPASPAERESC